MKKEIRDEIEDIAPRLAEIGNHNPFCVPSMYFEKLTIDIETELESSEKGVPSNYFKNLSDQIIATAKTEIETRVISINVKRWVAAASIAILFTASYFTMNTNVNQSFVLDVELEEAFDYLDHQDDLFMSEVLELSQVEMFDETFEELSQVEIDFLLYEISLDDLDELL
jgi:hypothetical protein